MPRYSRLHQIRRRPGFLPLKPPPRFICPCVPFSAGLRPASSRPRYRMTSPSPITENRIICFDCFYRGLAPYIYQGCRYKSRMYDISDIFHSFKYYTHGSIFGISYFKGNLDAYSILLLLIASFALT